MSRRVWKAPRWLGGVSAGVQDHERQREVNMDEKREYLKVPEVAEVLRIARSRAYELVAEGEIPSIRIGRSVRVSRTELDRWLEEQRQPR
jgi:excisionase family DNA binding protein